MYGEIVLNSWKDKSETNYLKLGGSVGQGLRINETGTSKVGPILRVQLAHSGKYAEDVFKKDSMNLFFARLEV